ncbi:hypothetical protein [Niveibacterium umoris]|uniref:Tetratricopeptide (TPR) repeat protein n=1 Tax=Niveibacterium umoris TaxID=1193620 RepID=A0A840BGP0_9RHOO|nr:hypothetical protein [Niveibacterium umoris]MBB4010789.1 tetratricopeptide (TPR) repeat protein [Niveibacterium umoris]
MSLPDLPAALAAIDAALHVRPAEARELSEALLARAREAGDETALVAASERCARLADHFGRPEKGVAALEAALAAARLAGDTLGEAALEQQFGRLAYSSGDYREAKRRWAHCAALCAGVPAARRIAAEAAMGLGQICDAQGDYAAALRHHLAAHDHADPGDDYLRAKGGINLAVNQMRLGQSQPARTHLRDALMRSERAGLADFAAEAHMRLAELELAEGAHAAAREQATLAETQAAALECRWVRTNALSLLAQLDFAEGRAASALATLRQAIALLGSGAGATRFAAQLHYDLARYAEVAGETDAANEAYDAARALHARLKQELDSSPGDLTRALLQELLDLTQGQGAAEARLAAIATRLRETLASSQLS